MKSYKQVKEIIEYVRLFHEQMREFYERLHEKDEKHRVKILLDYLCRHEKLREETLAQYEEEALSNIMDAYFKYVPESITPICFKSKVIKSHMTVDDVVSIALELNNCLIEMYNKLIEQTNVKEVEEVFKSLLHRIEKEEKNLVRDASQLKDI